jgi:hypothetical protein
MRSTLFAAAVAATLTLAACGSDSSAEDAQVSVDSTAGPSDSVATEFSGDDSEDFCAMAREFDENDPTADLFTSEDPAALEADWAEASGLITGLAASSPDEIRADFTVLSDSFTAIGDLYAKYEWDVEKLVAASETDPEIIALSDTAETDAASVRVDAYMQEVCGIATDE